MKEASHSLKENWFPGDKQSKDVYLSHSPGQLLSLR